MRRCTVATCQALFTDAISDAERCPVHRRRTWQFVWSDPNFAFGMRPVLLRAQARMDARMAS